jgi:hypothetical protein
MESELVVYHDYSWSVDWASVTPIAIGILALAVLISLLAFRKK